MYKKEIQTNSDTNTNSIITNDITTPPPISKENGVEELRKLYVEGVNSEIFYPDSFIEEHGKELAYIIDGLLYEGTFNILAGNAKCGKSTLTRQMISAIINGKDFLGRACTPVKVLWIICDEPNNIAAIELKKFPLPANTKDVIISRLNRESNKIDSIDKIINQFTPKLVIIDVLHSVLDGVGDSNSYSQVNKMIEPLKSLRDKYNVALLCLHHTTKAGNQGTIASMMGSAAFGAATDNNILLTRAAKHSTITTDGRVGSDFQDVKINFDQNEYQFKLAPTQKPLIEKILEHIEKNPNETSDQIRKAVGAKSQTVHEALTTLAEEGLVERKPGRNSKILYKLVTLGNSNV